MILRLDNMKVFFQCGAEVQVGLSIYVLGDSWLHLLLELLEDQRGTLSTTTTSDLKMGKEFDLTFLQEELNKDRSWDS